MYFNHFLQILLSIGLYVWEKRNHSSGSLVIYQHELCELRTDANCIRWVFDRVQSNVRF